MLVEMKERERFLAVLKDPQSNIEEVQASLDMVSYKFYQKHSRGGRAIFVPLLKVVEEAGFKCARQNLASFSEQLKELGVPIGIISKGPFRLSKRGGREYFFKDYFIPGSRKWSVIGVIARGSFSGLIPNGRCLHSTGNFLLTRH